jgi:Tol biopolymer transport system component
METKVDGSETRMISDLVENDGSFAWSQDGSHLAYVEMDRNLGEARLMVEDIKSNSKTTIASLPIPKGSGSSLPSSANLSWSSDGKSLVFEFGRGNSDRVIYLASAAGSGLVKLAESAHAPAISADGKCVAYINDKQVFLLDLTVPSALPVLLANLPAGRETSEFRLDKLGWRPDALSTAFRELITTQ